MAAPDIVTFGCRLNSFESEVMRASAQQAGLQDAVIINTCAVTGEAVRQARQAVRKARRERPDARIIVTGCAAQLEADTFAAMPEVDRVLGNMEKLSSAAYLSGANAKVAVNDIMAVNEIAGHLVDGFSERARAFVQIQQGCDHRCSFCIIPFARGNSRSAPLGDVVTQVRRLVQNGYLEVVLTGVDITSYGGDLPGQPSLTQMVRRLLALVPELPRLRLSSIDAVELDDSILELLAAEPRLMPHLHLSLQSGDNMILKRMKRRHSREDAIRFCQDARAVRPDIAFGADLIAGFPTESEAMFENSLALIEDCGLDFLHVFPYSERPGTAAARMPQVDPALRKERGARLRAAGERAKQKFLAGRIGSIAEVLIERPGQGHSEHFAKVSCAENLTVGAIHRLKITGARDGQLKAD